MSARTYKHRLFFLLLLLGLSTAGLLAQPEHYPPAQQVAADFRARVQRPVDDFIVTTRLIVTDSVLILRGTVRMEHIEKKEVIPFVIYKPVDAAKKKLPVVICLHGTGGNKDDARMKDILYRLSRMGIMGVAIDARYHGGRVAGGGEHSSDAYVAAITRAWKNKDTAQQDHPFFFDTVSDLWLFTDYIARRPDVDSARIGMMGVSMGGIETWMAASVDKRIKVTVPIIAAQSFRWSLDNDRWQGRAHTIWGAHQQAAADLGDTAVNKKNVQALWDKLLPGITGEFDCPSMLRLFAPRPLLLLSNEKDQNCPLPGAKIAYAAAREAYQSAGAADKLEMVVAPNEPHRLLPEEITRMLAFFGKWL